MGGVRASALLTFAQLKSQPNMSSRIERIGATSFDFREAVQLLAPVSGTRSRPMDFFRHV